ncbi:hypothetical protein vBBceSLY1_00013 [Bacillus phage vB_BceS_LY1]|uniref:Uncharacterized protein n=1 Tax=Bacillus phage vB_BceS_LY1 TaxID=2950459 RepID=A0AAE9LUM7_9CAUD|nr:hypothetical protein vBBceSLY1_00013 [Bacillus phage vB_BceS_LY1]
MRPVYALKFFTKSGLSRVLAMPSEKACYRILDDMRVNGAVIHIGRRCYRYEEMENIWIDDKQVYPMRLTQPISLDMEVRR